MSKLSSHFNLNEAECKCGCGYICVNPILIRLLEAIRYKAGNNPVMIHSWCRCEKHNIQKGGKPDSQHRYGIAADISIKGISPMYLAEIARKSGADGVGIYKKQNFVHVDVRGYPSSWEED